VPSPADLAEVRVRLANSSPVRCRPYFLRTFRNSMRTVRSPLVSRCSRSIGTCSSVAFGAVVMKESPRMCLNRLAGRETEGVQTSAFGFGERNSQYRRSRRRRRTGR